MFGKCRQRELQVRLFSRDFNEDSPKFYGYVGLNWVLREWDQNPHYKSLLEVLRSGDVYILSHFTERPLFFIREGCATNYNDLETTL